MTIRNHASSSLFSTVVNTSGRKKKFGFLPPHGRELAANEEYSVFGQITEAIQRSDRAGGARSRYAFQQAIDRGDIEIVRTPNPILQDESGTFSKMIVLHAGALALHDPSWESQASQDDPVAGA